jgi:polyhydroxybutyrate depolymerase
MRKSLLAVTLVLACSGNEDTQPAAVSGATAGGTAGFGALPSGGGVAGGAGPSTAGAGANGGSTSTVGGAPATAGVGGANAAGGGAGSNAGAAGGGGQSTATPSAGCAKAGGRPAAGAISVPDKHYLTFPESYDGTRPYPVLMAFHGCGQGNRGTKLEDTEWIRLTDDTPFETEYVRAVPISESTGGCWSYNTDVSRVKAMFDDLKQDHCVDTSRIFATGHSSGAQFVVQILLQSHTSDAEHLGFKAVAPVAASDYGPMKGPIPVMYIQGKMDAERGNGDGHETVEKFRAANSCGNTSQPYAPVMGCQSGATAVNPGCVSYDGCQAPTVWCSHNDPQYGTSMHGVPCFGVQAMYDFFQTFP